MHENASICPPPSTPTPHPPQPPQPIPTPQPPHLTSPSTPHPPQPPHLSPQPPHLTPFSNHSPTPSATIAQSPHPHTSPPSSPHLTPSATACCFHKGVENLYPHKDWQVDIYSCFIHNFQNLEATKVSFSRCTVHLAHPGSSVLFSANKKGDVTP